MLLSFDMLHGVSNLNSHSPHRNANNINSINTYPYISANHTQANNIEANGRSCDHYLSLGP